MKRLVLLALLLAAPAKHGYRLLDGPMPHLAPLPAAPPPVVDPHLAPVPNLDAEPPANPAGTQPRLVPSLTDRRSGGPEGDGYSPGSSYSQQLERRHDPGTNIGNVLAPGLQLRVPLQ